jgi:hypothetical protein
LTIEYRNDKTGLSEWVGQEHEEGQRPESRPDELEEVDKDLRWRIWLLWGACAFRHNKEIDDIVVDRKTEVEK